MIVFVCGLPGTGKTTLCKNLATQYNLTYINDYEILSKFNLKFENSLEIIDKDYSYQVNEFFSEFDIENCIFDFNYCILPEKINKLLKLRESVIVYLGYYEVEIDDLVNRFKERYQDFDVNYIKQLCELFIEVSKKYKVLCDESEIDFVSINNDKQAVMKKLQTEISLLLNN